MLKDVMADEDEEEEQREEHIMASLERLVAMSAKSKFSIPKMKSIHQTAHGNDGDGKGGGGGGGAKTAPAQSTSTKRMPDVPRLPMQAAAAARRGNYAEQHTMDTMQSDARSYASSRDSRLLHLLTMCQETIEMIDTATPRWDSPSPTRQLQHPTTPAAEPPAPVSGEEPAVPTPVHVHDPFHDVPTEDVSMIHFDTQGSDDVFEPSSAHVDELSVQSYSLSRGRDSDSLVGRDVAAEGVLHPADDSTGPSLSNNNNYDGTDADGNVPVVDMATDDDADTASTGSLA
eukprot:PhM_4_TR7112/c0_g1_i1/m.31400